MFSLKEKFINFDTIKGFINYLESSVSMSFNDLDNSIIKNVPKELKDVKKTKKLIKKGIIKDLINELILNFGVFFLCLKSSSNFSNP